MWNQDSIYEVSENTVLIGGVPANVNKYLTVMCGRPPVYKDDITISRDGIPLCLKGFSMKQAAKEPKKGRIKYRCLNICR